MRKNLINKIGLTVLLFVSTFFNYVLAADPPIPIGPPGSGGDGGTGGEGIPAATPIDMYQIVLLIVAIGLVTYFYKKIKLSKI